MNERGYRRSLRPALIASAFTLIAVGGALAVRPVTAIGPADGPLWSWALGDGFSMQPRYAWTAGEALLRVPGAGWGAWDLEIELSGWRPRGRPAPRIVVRSGEASQALVAGRETTTVALPVVSRSWLGAVVDAEIRSDTFGLSLTFLLAFLGWRDRRATRWIVYCTLLAGALAFGLYYVHWAWPFIAESAPRLLGLGPRHVGSSGGELASVAWGRLMRQPDKLTYTFGSGLVPILGLAGLFLARPWRSRAALLAWGAILPVVCVLDVQFNFLLKHHYYTIVPVCIGGGLLLARLETSARWIRWATWLLLLAAVVLGMRAAASAAVWYGA